MEPWSSLVEVHWADGAEAYVTPVARDEVGVACLWRGDGDGFDALLARFPALCERLRGAEPTSAVLGAGPFSHRALRSYRGRVALVGDAAGCLDPLTGEGITVGLWSARALVRTLARGESLRAYALRRRRILAVPRALTRLLLLAEQEPRVRGGVISVFARHPAVFDRLLALNAGEPLRASRARGAVWRARGRAVKRAEVSAELARHAAAHPEDDAVIARFARLLEDTPAPFSRDQARPGHLTCSACVIDASRTHVLLLHHARLGRWLQPGGHAEPGDATPLAGALRELREESGLDDAAPLCGAAGSALVDLDVHDIPARGAEPAHLHYDLRYAFAAHGRPTLRLSGESIALRWVEIARLRELTDEESVTRLVARALARAELASSQRGFS